MENATSRKSYSKSTVQYVLEFFTSEGAPAFEVVAGAKGRAKVRGTPSLIACVTLALDTMTATSKALARNNGTGAAAERVIARAEDRAIRAAIVDAKRTLERHELARNSRRAKPRGSVSALATVH